MTDHPESVKPLGWIRSIISFLACVAILAASGGAIMWINATEPTAQQIDATRKSAALVETIRVQCGTFSPRLVVLGTVRPAEDITLSPRVSGQVVELSAEFVPGGMVKKGDELIRIDPADFENALSISKSELRQTEASLAIEEGRQSLAKKELELLEGSIDETNRALVLREPQIASIRAEVSAAEAAVERAQLNLDRAKLLAPFDAQILERSVNVGSQVSNGDNLARLVGVKEYWVMAALPVRNLRWVQFPDDGEEGSRVTLRNQDSWPEGTQRTGRVAKMIGSVDEQSRLARIVISVADPLGLQSDVPPLILNTLIQTEIEGRKIENVCRIDRQYVRGSDTAWVMKDDVLEIRPVKVTFRDAQYAYIREGLEDGEEIVISTLATVADGVGLRKIESEQSEPSSEDSLENGQKTVGKSEQPSDSAEQPAVDEKDATELPESSEPGSNPGPRDEQQDDSATAETGP